MGKNFKQLYVTPITETVMVKVESGLLQNSNSVSASRNSYGAANTAEWD